MANIVKLNYTADEINERLGKVCDVVQTTGSSETAVMSQKAISDTFSSALLKAKVSGEVVQVDDVSSVNHTIKCKFDTTNNTVPILDKIAPISKEVVSVEGNIVKIAANASVYGFKLNGVQLEVGKTYTFSVGDVSDHGSVWGWNLAYADGTSVSTPAPYYDKWTVEITQEVTAIRYYIGKAYSGNKDVYITYPRIEESSNLNDYRICRSKNLIPFPYHFGESATQKGVTATVQEDGGIVLNGTTTGDIFFVLSDRPIDADHKIAPFTKYNHENYTFSRKFVSNSSGGNDTDVYRWDVYSNANGSTYLELKANNTFENEVVYPQIEVGQKSTSFEKGDSLTLLDIDENGYCELPSSSSMTIWATNGAPVEVEYIRDLNAEIASLKPNARLEEYNMPILYIEGDTCAMSKEIECSLRYRFGDRTGTCTMKWQGSSSIAHPKKNYTIKFDNKFEAKEGWGNQKKYCLKANYVDASHARNIVCAKLWGQFVKSRTVTNERLNALPNGGAIDGFPIIMVLNGEFHGLYTFNIPKDEWMFGMGDSETEAILCADSAESSSGATAFKAEATLQAGVDFEVEYAPDENNTEWIKTSINRLINAVRNSDGSDIDTVIAQYLDIDSAIDYYIFEVFTQGNDNGTRNYLLSTYDGVKWFFTGYDMDSTLGLAPNSGFTFCSANTSHYSFNAYANMHYLMGFLRTYKKDAIKARYAQLRENGAPLSDYAPMMTAAGLMQTIPQCVYNQDFDKWRGVKYTSINNYAQIADFMYKRLQYMDKTIETL